MSKQKRYSELSKLKGRIREKGLSYRTISAKTGITLHRLNDTLNGYYLSYVEEALLLCNILDIDTKDIPIYFNQIEISDKITIQKK